MIHRYTPHQVWSQVGESVARGEYELADHEFTGAFLFMDVNGFTAFSESRAALDVVRTLNAIFSPATRIIYECGGDVGKFIGDCIFAAFPDARAAAQAACRMLKLFDDLDPEASPFAVRIGINAGRAGRANVGSPARREYTFIGDAVNLAQRLESNATPGHILSAEAVWAAAKDLFAEASARNWPSRAAPRPSSPTSADPRDPLGPPAGEPEARPLRADQLQLLLWNGDPDRAPAQRRIGLTG